MIDIIQCSLTLYFKNKWDAWKFLYTDFRFCKASAPNQVPKRLSPKKSEFCSQASSFIRQYWDKKKNDNYFTSNTNSALYVW